MDQVAKMIRPRGILCDAADVNKTVDFWRSLPGFRKQAVNNTGAVLVCGDFMVRLRKTDGPPAPVDVPGIRGIEHLALAVQNAAAAIKEERYARFELNTDPVSYTHLVPDRPAPSGPGSGPRCGGRRCARGFSP